MWEHVKNHLPFWKLDPDGPFEDGDDITDNKGLYIICIFAVDACSARPKLHFAAEAHVIYTVAEVEQMVLVLPKCHGQGFFFDVCVEQARVTTQTSIWMHYIVMQPELSIPESV